MQPSVMLRVPGALIFAWALAGCDPKPPATPTPKAISSADASATEAPHPTAAVKPQSGDAPAAVAKPGAGPAEGSTAIGGLAGHQATSPPKSGAAPAPTGGDGSAPSSSPPK